MTRSKAQLLPLASVLALIALLIACANGAQAISLALTTPEPSVAIDQPAGVANDTLAEADGYIADGESLTPFDTTLPAIGKLNPALLGAVQRAANDAASDGVTLSITSGWRSVRYQQALLEEAIATYGSEEEARKWVATPGKSAHVTGNAVDIGPAAAAAWLNEHGYRYGLCRIYANEAWHFELATKPGGACPPLVRDASIG